MADEPRPAAAPDGLPSRRLRGGGKAATYATEAEIAAAAVAAVAKRKGPDGKPLTQQQIADAFGVPQSVVSQALGYVRKDNRNRGHALRRRIVQAWGGGDSLRFAGPFWLAVGHGDTDPTARFAAGEDPYPEGDGTPPPADLDAAA